MEGFCGAQRGADGLSKKKENRKKEKSEGGVIWVRVFLASFLCYLF